LGSLYECIIWYVDTFMLWFIPMHHVMVYILLAICNSHGFYIESVLPCLKALGGIKYCVRFSVLTNPVKTLSPVWSSGKWSSSPVWSSGKWSSSPVWSSGRGLVRVLYPIAYVKQWGGERCFTLFWLVASIVSGVQCIDIFTHNSLRNKGDSLAAIMRHIEPFVLGN